MTRARDMANIAAGSFSIPSGSLTNAVPAAGSITNSMLANGAITAADLPAGTVLQVVSNVDNTQNGYTNYANSGWQDIAGMSVTLTPQSSSSKLFITASISVGHHDWGVMFRVLQDGNTTSLLGTTGDSRPSGTFGTVGYVTNDDEVSTGSFSGIITAGTTSATTIKIQGAQRSDTNGSGWSVNRADDSPTTNTSRVTACSSIVVMEIAA